MLVCVRGVGFVNVGRVDLEDLLSVARLLFFFISKLFFLLLFLCFMLVKFFLALSSLFLKFSCSFFLYEF